VRAVMGRFSTVSSGSHQRSNSTTHGISSHRRRSLIGGRVKGTDNTLSSGNWDNIKGHKLDSDAEGASLHLRPSFDNIPLVTSAGSKSKGDLESGGYVLKTTEVSVSSSIR
jgi:hypothetical protein